MGCRTLTCFWLGCFTLTLLILSCMVIPFDHGFSPWWQKGNVRSRMYYIVLFCLCRDWPFTLRTCCSVFCTVSIPTYSTAWSLPFWSWVLTLMAKRKCEKQNVFHCPFLSLQRLAIYFENLLLCVPYCLHPHLLNCVVTPFLIMGSHLDGKKELWEAKCITLSFSVFAETGQ